MIGRLASRSRFSFYIVTRTTIIFASLAATILFFLTPGVSFGQTSSTDVAALQQQIAQLSQQLAQLQQQKAQSLQIPGTTGSSAGTAACAALPSPLGPGSSGVNVSALQRFLARDPSIYPEAQITGYYGAFTTGAVKRFQIRYNIVSSGSPTTTGFGKVGPKTLAMINSLCGGGSSPVVGAFMQVSPDKGPAPLYVNVQATVNTTNSCQAATYTLDFGDQSQAISIPVQPGTCQPLQQTYTHTYQQPATYEITLSSGSHSSQAEVVVQ